MIRAISYLLAWLFAALFIACCVFGLYIAVVGSVAFVTWDVGLLYAMNHLLIFQISVAVGVLIGMLFIFDKEGQECARIIEKGLTK